MQEQLKAIREKVLADLAEIKDSQELEKLRVRVLGKKGELTGILRGMGKLPADLRPKMGQLVNETRARLEEAIAEAEANIKEREKNARLKLEAIDVTMPVEERAAGSLHPMNIVRKDVLEVFAGLGVEVGEGPEVE